MRKQSAVKTYESVQLNQVLHEALHPGGPGLTERMAEVAGLDQTSRILDVGCGRGTSILFFARHYGCQGTGIDLSPTSIAVALERCADAGMSKRAQFTVADACQLPYPDAEFDVVFGECALSLITDKAGAFHEIARVVRPGGQILLSDIVLKHELSDSFKQELGFVCCFTEALTLEGYQSHASDAGLDLLLEEDHSIALKQTAYRLSAGYGSIQEFWSQFGQGELSCCNSGAESGGAGGGWKALFKQARPGYWLLAWEK